MSPAADETVYAAGTICWREIKGVLHLLVIHRTVQQDDTFPKGKVDPGETLPQAAVRETWEESGVAVNLGAPLGLTRYALSNGKSKEVHYWAAEVSDEVAKSSTFTSNDEVESIRWVPIHKVAKELTYDLDREVLARFEKLVHEDGHKTFSLIFLRHAKALDPLAYRLPDQSRPLADRGMAQAENIAGTLPAWGAAKIISSSSLRCIQTVEPVARLLGRKITTTDDISQHVFHGESEEITDLIDRRLHKKKNAIICSHGPVLPVLLAELASATGTGRAPELDYVHDLDTASFIVAHVRRESTTAPIVAMELHDCQI